MRKNITLNHLLLASALALVCAAYGLAQTGHSIAGRVTDPRGEAVTHASVTLYARGSTSALLSTQTDSSGAYRFERLTPGLYLIEVEAPGFARAVARDLPSEPARGGTQPLSNISLSLAGVSEEVVVTASSTAQTVDEVSKAITIVSAEEMDERDEHSIPEALRIVPGVRVQQLGGPGTLTSIRMRGLRDKDTAVLFDGLRFRDASTLYGDATPFLSDLLTTDTSRVEVLRGSGSSLYGTNAIGGVVNIVTNEGGGPLRGSFMGEGGSLALFRSRAQVAGGAYADRFVYSAGVSHLNVARGVDSNDHARSTNAQGRALFRLTPTATVSARIYAARSSLNLNQSPIGLLFGAVARDVIYEAVPLSRAELRRYEAGASVGDLNLGGASFIPSANDPDDRQRQRFFAGALIFAQQPTEKFGYSISYQTVATARDYRYGPAQPGVSSSAPPFGNTQGFDYGGRIHTFNARGDFRLGRHNFITTAYELETESFSQLSSPGSPGIDSTVDAGQRSHTFFAQDQLRLLDDRLQLSAAFRAQHFSLREPQFAPVASAPYQGINFEAPPTAYTGDGSVAYFFRSTGTKLRAHVGNGYRAPSLYERFGAFYSSFGYFTIGGPGLRPERSLSFDAGLDQNFYDNRLRASATYFYTRLQELIDFGLVAPGDPFGRFFGYINTQGGLARGVELSMRAAPLRSLDLHLAYTYTNADQRVPQIGSTLRSFNTPGHVFSLVATKRFGRRLFINFDMTATSDYLVPLYSPFAGLFGETLLYRFNGPVKADAGASYTLPMGETRSLRFFGQVENLFDREYFEGGFRTPGLTARAGAQFNF